MQKSQKKSILAMLDKKSKFEKILKLISDKAETIDFNKFDFGKKDFETNEKFELKYRIMEYNKKSWKADYWLKLFLLRRIDYCKRRLYIMGVR